MLTSLPVLTKSRSRPPIFGVALAFRREGRAHLEIGWHDFRCECHGIEHAHAQLHGHRCERLQGKQGGTRGWNPLLPPLSIEARLNSWSFDPPWGSLGPRHRRLVWLAIREQSL